MTIQYEACNGTHTIKREHLDEEGERTTYNVTEWDMWRAGYIDPARLETLLHAISETGCECPGSHADTCPVLIAEALEDFIAEGPDADEPPPALSAKKEGTP
jgi:hypothetical protein